MKSIKKYCTLIGLLMSFAATSGLNAGNVPEEKNAVVTSIKIKELTLEKEKLQAKIAAEDKKRNQYIEGVSPEAQESMNEKQDSICLDLRSRLVSVELELKELSPDKISSTMAAQYNALVQQNAGAESKQ